MLSKESLVLSALVLFAEEISRQTMMYEEIKVTDTENTIFQAKKGAVINMAAAGLTQRELEAEMEEKAVNDKEIVISAAAEPYGYRAVIPAVVDGVVLGTISFALRIKNADPTHIVENLALKVDKLCELGTRGDSAVDFIELMKKKVERVLIETRTELASLTWLAEVVAEILRHTYADTEERESEVEGLISGQREAQTTVNKYLSEITQTIFAYHDDLGKTQELLGENKEG